MFRSFETDGMQFSHQPNVVLAWLAEHGNTMIGSFLEMERMQSRCYPTNLPAHMLVALFNLHPAVSATRLDTVGRRAVPEGPLRRMPRNSATGGYAQRGANRGHDLCSIITDSAI